MSAAPTPTSDSDVPTEVMVTETPRRERTKLEPHQFDFVAMSLTNAVPAEEIAHCVECEPSYIIYLAKRNNPSFNRVWDGYKQRLLNETVAWRFKLLEMLPAGYAAIKDAIEQRKDPRLAAEQAWRVLEAVVPQSKPQAAPGGPSINFNLAANTQVQAQLADTITNVGAAFAALKSDLRTVDLGRHLRTGLDTAPRPLAVTESSTDEPLVAEDFTGGGNETGGPTSHASNNTAQATNATPSGSTGNA